jgi:SAM-dependent methyltransferase
LLDLLKERPEAIPTDGTVLVPGCGRGHDAAALHRAGRKVLALDLAPAALTEARGLYGSPAGLTWRLGDFLDPASVPADPVATIFEHTCFCAIDPARRPDYAAAAARWLQPGGRLVAIFFLDPDRDEGEEGPPFGAEREEIRGLFAGRFRFEREAVPVRAFPGREGREWFVELVKTH